MPSTEGTKEGTKKDAGYVDLTPTWLGLMPALIELAAQGNQNAKAELDRLANYVDTMRPKFTALLTAAKNALDQLGPEMGRVDCQLSPAARLKMNELFDAVSAFETPALTKTGTRESTAANAPSKTPAMPPLESTPTAGKQQRSR